jgi:arginyl-tRNA synthetase
MPAFRARATLLVHRRGYGPRSPGESSPRYHRGGSRTCRAPRSSPSAPRSAPRSNARGTRPGRGASPWPDGTDRRRSRSNAADPSHGDIAAHLALKLARRTGLHRSPSRNAIADELRREAAEDPTGTLRRDRRRSRDPGSSTSRLADTAVERRSRASCPSPRRGVASPRAVTGAVNRRVRVGQPDRPAPRRQRARAFIGDLLSRVLEAGGQRSRASTTSTTSAARSATSGASVAAHPPRRGRPEDGYHGDYVTTSRPRCPDDLDEARPRPAPTPTAPRALGGRRVREGIEASLASLGVRFDVWTSEARLHDEGWVERASSACASADHVNEQDGATGSGRPRSATTRTA